VPTEKRSQIHFITELVTVSLRLLVRLLLGALEQALLGRQLLAGRVDVLGDRRVLVLHLLVGLALLARNVGRRGTRAGRARSGLLLDREAAAGGEAGSALRDDKEACEDEEGRT